MIAGPPGKRSPLTVGVIDHVRNCSGSAASPALIALSGKKSNAGLRRTAAPAGQYGVEVIRHTQSSVTFVVEYWQRLTPLLDDLQLI